ncbi:sucrase-isomaltase, intestinal-like [Amphiura filiformis]|uniref:sucrase-isomaltase, intestinal-like n=1 Tax=Amphiura filiformis TaxID=82378 RepID=UPI003B221FE8
MSICSGCEWCATYVDGFPFCFDNTKPGYDGTCYSTIPPHERQDCWPKPEGSNAKCVDAGCTWCPLDGYAWCFYDDTVPPTGPTIPPTGPTEPPTSAPGCPSTIPPLERVDCHPENGASKPACESRGCYWCEDFTPNVPWCSYPDRNIPNPTGDPGTCPSEIPEPNRIDCFPGGGASKGECEARDCFWCESSTDGVPWCFFNITGEGSDPEKDIWRVDCAPDGGFDNDICMNRGCNFMGTSVPNAPICYFPEDRGYKMTAQEDTATGYKITLQKQGTYTLFGGDVETLTMDVHFETNGRLHIKITDATQARFEVPIETPVATSKASNPLYEFVFTNDPIFNFNVTRKDTGVAIIDTSLGGFVYEDQFLSFATKLPPNSEVYGFGEHEHHSIQHELKWQTMGMYSRDQPPAANGNLYGVYPMWMVIEDGINTHGVLILNAAAQDVTLSPAPYINYRTIGGILDIYVFLGPKPEDVVSQYTETVGRPFMPPYWSLGFQLCRYGYMSLAKVQETVDRMRAYNIPYDIQYGDIDYMDEQRDFTIDPVNYNGLPEYVDKLRSQYGMHYIIILDPCIGIVTDGSYDAFNTGEAMDVWIKEGDCSTSAIGKVWPPENTYFPDYTKPITETWWTDECVKFHNILDYDGLWIDMNEPANFVTGGITGCQTNKWNNPPYFPAIWGNVLADKTMCADFCQHLGSHYDLHSLYGFTQSKQTLPAARAATPGKRSIVISRSTFPGTGKYAGHWLGDNYSQWSNLHYSIIGSLEFNMFGIPYVGADICGFNGDSNADMCQRWMQLGAFYTFSRNHNGINYKEQDPAAFGDEVARVSRETLEIRYTLLPYLYTLFYHAHVNGNTVMRPLFHEFVEDAYTHTIDRQLLWGPAFLITPVLEDGFTNVDAYFPDARWFDYYTGAEAGFRKKTVNLDAPMDYIPLHVRGGYILPTQEPAVTTTISRNNAMGLIVALNDFKQASGELFWDDGDSIDTYETGNHYFAEFAATASSLTSTIITNGYSGASSLLWGTVRVFGATATSVTVNGKAHGDFSTPIAGVLEIYNVKIPIDVALNPNASPEECEARGCIWCESPVDLVPWCYFPVDREYLMTSQVDTPTGYRLVLQKQGTDTLFGGDINLLTMDVHFETVDRLHIKITDAGQARFEVPLDTPAPTSKATNPNYEFNVNNNPIFNFNVKRKDTGSVIFDTSLGGFVYEDQFLQFTHKMPRDSEVFGLGEHEHPSLRHDTSTWQTMGMWARDQPPVADANLYGVHPFWWVIEDGINTHGVFVLNANAQDVTMSPAPYITYRTIGGILDIYIFMGPTPEMLVSQYTQVVGRTFMPPYWSLGFQLCRYGYNSLATMQATVDRNRAAGIPYDIQYGDIDYMDEERDFTYNQVDFAGLPAYVDTLHGYGMHVIIILDPCIAIIRDGSYEAFDTGEAMNIWVKNSDCITSAEGKVWPPENTYFPDYSKPITQTWWTDECVKFHDIIDYDGLWIDMNEPANFVTGSITGCNTNKYNNPPYKPRVLGDILADKTMCPDACHYLGRHYDMHNLFGYTQAIQTQPAARAATPGKRSVVISRSTFPGLGQYSGHWLGDNWSQWSNLHYSIIGSLEFNMFGIPYIGADICGYIGEAEESMCQRWMQLGSFYTFSRNHNGLGYREQDPAVWAGGEVARVSRETLLIRYTLLPYLYTLFHHSHINGYTVMRPVFHEFIDDAYTHGIDRQFLWGSAFLITPVLDQGATDVDAYFPDARWYDYYTGAEVGLRKKTVNLDAPMDYIPLHVRGGYILPTQEPDITTTASRNKPMGLIVAMDDLKSALGDLFWDDGDSIGQYFSISLITTSFPLFKK